ncbi:MAG TPA: DMT family transporter [Oscillatoriales cyanobacterium M59_W2019_021]|nr:MAG: DMT family transporter [Cyanobacteria bacterium J055]HIK32446.1 DMT family transporter [Oscillatoriales cyanobacterium M4454_W2019_049]HIK50426.1 DMT family transporter [Oscillatoriales cyanobacterium M59_W2019_021]
MELKLARSKFDFTPLLLIAPFFLWGTAMVAMKGVMSDTTPLFLASLRIAPAGALVLMAAAMMGKSQPRSWQAWLWILLFALVDGTMFQGFLAEGLVRTGAGLGSVAIDSQPLIVALLSGWFYQERIGWKGWLGLGLGIVGIAAIGLPDTWIDAFLAGEVHKIQLGELFEGGVWLMLLASVSMALGTVMMPKVSEYVDPVVATGWHMILGGLPLLGMSAIWESQQWANIHGWGWCAIAYSTVFGSAIAYGLFFYFASKGNLTRLSALTFMTPVFALFFGNLLLAEVLTPLQWAGGAIALLGVWSIERGNRPDLEENVSWASSDLESEKL